MKKNTKKGGNIIIFPEGWESEDNEIYEYKSGIGHIALISKFPILPIYLNYDFHNPKKIQIIYGELITWSSMQSELENLDQAKAAKKIANIVELKTKELKNKLKSIQNNNKGSHE